MSSFFDNGGFIGVSAPSTFSTGVWNLQSVAISKTPVFYDDFETFSGWVTVGSGVVAQSSAQAYEGTFSALKSAANDPNGAYKLFDAPVYRSFTLDVWLYSVDPRVGGGADRIAIVDSTGNGYGFSILSGVMRSEIRNTYIGTSIVTDTAITRPSNAWYRVVFTTLPNNTFVLDLYNSSGTLLGQSVSPSDTTYAGPFDRVAILGGNAYHVDNMTVTLGAT